MKTSTLTLATMTAALLACSSGSSSSGDPPKPQASAAPSAAPSASPAATAGVTAADLTPEERREFYHLPEGGELLPLDLLRALESSATFKPFMENIERFGLIADPGDPDGLPVGMSATEQNGKRVEPRSVFFNCAACHTAEITYQGKSIRVDGAPAHADIAGLIEELLGSLNTTVLDPKKLTAFSQRVIKLHLDRAGNDKGSLADKLAAEKQKLAIAADAVKLLKEKVAYLDRLRALRTTAKAGFGRLDAFVAARNLLFDPKYGTDVNSPVSLPPIFGLTRLSWYHYDNNTTSLIQRNIGEDLGMGSVADLSTGESNVLVRNLFRLETLAGKLPVPRWPEAMLGKLDAERVGRGAVIYKKECASCHDHAADGSFPDRVTPLADIGTDPNRLVNFNKPVDRPFAEALAAVVDKVEKKAFEREHVTPEEAAKMEPKNVVWRSTTGYSSRPIDGVWCTAPYLHNGSVPTLYDLLLPPAQRPKTFQTGSHEYDPKKVGYVSDGSQGGSFHFDTGADANHNTGHLYGTTLSEAERMDLLEYLKSR